MYWCGNKRCGRHWVHRLRLYQRGPRPTSAFIFRLGVRELYARILRLHGDSKSLFGTGIRLRFPGLPDIRKLACVSMRSFADHELANGKIFGTCYMLHLNDIGRPQCGAGA